MSVNRPDCFVLLKMGKIYKILVGWSGGYLYGDSWKINSGIIKYTEEDGVYTFHGESGSIYKVHKDIEGLRMSIALIYHQLILHPAVTEITLLDFLKEFKQ